MDNRKRKNYDEPNMSDRTLIVSVEDLIFTAFGPANKNIVNFKLIQTILHILARQMRLLEQDVEIKFDEIGVNIREAQQAIDYDEQDYRPSYTSSSSEGEEYVRDAGHERERKKGGGRDEKGGREGKGERGEKKGRDGKDELGEKGRREGKGERREKGGPGGKGERDERGGPGGKGERDERGGPGGKGERGKKGGKEGQGERDEKGGPGGKGERGEKVGKGERGEKGEKKEKRGKSEKEGKTPSHDREGKGRSKDRDEQDREDRRSSRDREYGRSRDREDRRSSRDREGRRSSRDREGRRSSRDREGRRSSRDREGRRSSKDKGYKGSRDREDRRSSRDREDRRSSRDREGRRSSKDKGYKGSRDREDRRSRDTGSAGKSSRGTPDGRTGAARQGSGTSITVTEASRRDGRGILIAERGPASRRQSRVGSIEVVTASQFALLERAVKQLEHFSGPLPVPALPDNEQLRKDLAKGRASLSETMQAVQLNARVQAAEQGLSRMAELLTQLAKVGALPIDLAGRIEQMQAELKQATLEARPAGAAGAGTARFVNAEHGGTGAGKMFSGAGKEGRSTKPLADTTSTTRMISKKGSPAGSAGVADATGQEVPFGPPGVTHAEMHDVLEYMKDVISKEIQTLTARANHSADMASNTSRSVAQKLDVAMQINDRISNLFAQTDDYANQLSGFDTGLVTQMTSFQEQMVMMRNDLTGGLTLLASANNNAETAAILDLSERYESLVIELDNTVQLHQDLSTLQQQLSDELRSLVECVEMLREQKADRDEVLDGLRDKADLSRLAGLLYEKDFARARYEIEKRLSKCYEKFHNQNQVWQTALGDLTSVTENKADIYTVMALKESATQELNNIQEKLRKLEIMLGEPKAALLMRQLAKDAACGACLTRAMMPLTDASYGKPWALPPLRLPPALGAEDLCLVQLSPADTRDHICHRWVGGSHTLIGGHVKREKADAADLQAMPTKKFGGYGTDGRMYLMEEDLQPCAECNNFDINDSGHGPHSLTPTGGGGDQARVGPGLGSHDY